MDRELRILLKSVSRSFYTSLVVLPTPLRSPVSLAYLLCRYADTIADTTVLPYDKRLSRLQIYRSLYENFPPSSKQFEDFMNLFLVENESGSPTEKKLMTSLGRCATLLARLSRSDQALIQEVVQSVCQGMEKDLRTFGDSPETLKAFSTKDDLEVYIDWIGGGPGQFWTKMCLLHIPTLKNRESSQWIQWGTEFGKGLQIINILRDINEDLHNGRCYIPKDLLRHHDLYPEDLLKEDRTDQFLPLYHQLIEETLQRLAKGLLYLQAIPPTSWRLRAAVWWPLAIGLKTLGKLRQERNILRIPSKVKIPRRDVYALMGLSPFVLPFNSLLRWEFEDMAGAASASMEGYTKKKG